MPFILYKVEPEGMLPFEVVTCVVADRLTHCISAPHIDTTFAPVYFQLMSDSLRLFIALELPSNVLTRLEQLQQTLRTRLPDKTARWVRPSGIHLTLKFIGNVPSQQVDAIVTAMIAAAEGIPPFELSVQSLGAFPNPQAARVLWISLEGALHDLGNLQKAVEQHIVPLGYPTEKRPFHPHLTLARVRRNSSRKERQHLGALLMSAESSLLATWQVTAVSLMRSQLRAGGAIYTQLAEATLTAM